MLAATKYRQRGFRMPRPCAVETHARRYKRQSEGFSDATALRRGDSCSPLQKTVRGVFGCHGLAPWRLRLAATKDSQRGFRMPRPCAVVADVPLENKQYEMIVDR